MPHDLRVPLPPLFARRFRSGMVIMGATLLVTTPLMYAFLRFVGSILSQRPDPITAVVIAVPPLFVLALAVTMLLARRCLDGDRLVVARARTIRNALVVCLGGVVVGAALIAIVPGPTNPLTYFEPVVYLFMGVLGFSVGHMFVRPSRTTLLKFSDGSLTVR
ncbi:hypothetical protein [Allokutzneria sp. NRRL B-24872]|uniref:hypothetical protein n=1 Tax=Allokutzneria sp. NRRL B-24872 TaxID=1137961 RepID=UPI000A3AB5CC|nr:hypothetical protein [Allokutzneria sp. NRRL B-24872]